MRSAARSDAVRVLAALIVVVLITLVLGRWLQVTNAATVSTTYLLVVLLVAATSRLRVAVATSVAAMLALNFFFLPPVGTFTIADPHNWVALFAFLVVSLVASNLSAVARDRTEEALGRRNELARLFDLSRDVLMMTESREALAVLAANHCAPVRPGVRRGRGAARRGLGHPRRWRADDSGRHSGSCPMRTPPHAPAWNSMRMPEHTPVTARPPSTGTSFDWCPCGSGRSRSASSPPPAGPWSQARSTRSPAWSRSPLNVRTFSKSGRPPS